MITCTLLTTHNVVITTIEGRVEDSDVLEHYRQLYERPDWRPGTHELFDLRAADVSRITSGAIRILADMVDRAHSGSEHGVLTAVLVDTDFQFGMSRMYQAYAAEFDERIEHFREAAPALRWLGAPEDLYS